MFVFESNSHKKNCLVLFLGQYTNSARAGISSQLQNAYENHLTPDFVIFLYPGYLREEIGSLLSVEGFEVDLKRPKNSPILCVNFDEEGKFKVDRDFNKGEHLVSYRP